MDLIKAFGNVIDTLKKYNDSRYIRYDDVSNSSDYKTPQDYGAGGKGFTDDTAAINQAIAENDVVYIPNGIYNISSPIIVAESGKKIYGNSDTKIMAKGCDGVTITAPSGMILRDLQIVGDGSAHHGIVLDGGGYKTHFSNLSVTKFGGDGFRTNWFGGGFGVCTIEKCTFRNCDNGIVCMSDASDQRNNITIANNLIGQITHSAIRVTGCGIIVEGNDIEGCEYGIRVDNWDAAPERDDFGFCGSAAIRIVGNYMEHATRSFISFATNYRRETETEKKKDGLLDGVTIEGNYGYLNQNVEISDQFAWLEIVSEVFELETGVRDITFSGNVFNTNMWPLPTLIRGNGYLTDSCRFVISMWSRGECVDMGDAVIVKSAATATE